jgi:hypothetical protein
MHMGHHFLKPSDFADISVSKILNVVQCLSTELQGRGAGDTAVPSLMYSTLVCIKSTPFLVICHHKHIKIRVFTYEVLNYAHEYNKPSRSDILRQNIIRTLRILIYGKQLYCVRERGVLCAPNV